MHKTAKMPPRPKAVLHIATLTVLASFAACSHGSEPRHPITLQAERAPAVKPDGEALHQPAVKPSIVRAAEQVPAPSGVYANANLTAPADPPSPSVRHPDHATPVVDHAEAASPISVPDEATSGAAAAQITAAPRAPAPIASPKPVSVEDTVHWPILAGAGIAAVSLGALALFRRRDREAAAKWREEEELRKEEIREAAEQEAASHEARYLAAEAAAKKASETVAALEAERAATVAAAQDAQQLEVARAAAAEAAEERERIAAAEAAAAMSDRQLDPRIEAAHRLHDLLHRAERDVEPFLHLLDATVPADASSNDARLVLASWHESVLGARNRLSEALQRHNYPADLHASEPAADLHTAVGRLLDHAARMSAVMLAQQQQDSSILHWSRLLPGALVQLFWRAQTAKYTSSMVQLPKVPDAPAPVASVAVPVPVSRPARTHDKAIQQALRGSQRSAAYS